MRKIATIFLAVILSVTCFQAKGEESSEDNNITLDEKYKTIMKQDLLCLMMGYPDHIEGVVKENSGLIYVVMKSGNKILYDDMVKKNIDQKLKNPDLQDMLEQVYPLTSISSVMKENFDPGRIRVYSLLHEVYGKNKGEIEKNLRCAVNGLRFNSNNYANDRLVQIMKQIGTLSQTNGKAMACVYPINGTYNYRVISGTGRLSPHSFGIAIDLASNPKDYWQWASLEQGNQRIKEYPKELPQVFENNYFIWGGKWSHFDILHYEYRPEIIIKARYFRDGSENITPWYGAVDTKNEKVAHSIEVINNAVG
ncbi:M15 family metallopeptidase [Clostridium cellulovorans]|uniref:Peptidase M15C domain-containing protein n=1 Tax=Clostridium cellulovorans (strain ATCC 35296 / DSM 3052 / OCM 3 / 743B) TaxID=573061 RepID=D9SMB1_CLOC7|nr:M15 family metallopeptidase [Clostridium cellulovorans]ADL53767.1 hypothetical protein Clocel_4105 [Clostridium cellulovorans 743B]